MMLLTRIIAIAVVGFGFGAGTVQAQDLGSVQGPSELPPASYRGAQYVDSNGCVFIRAGIDGNINWVPRVNRQRELICDQTPTLSGAQRPIAPDPAPPVVAQPAPAPAAPTAQPAPRQVTTAAAPRPQPRAPQPTVVRRAPPVATTAAPAPAAQVVRQTRPSAATTVSPQTRVVPRHVYDAKTANETFPVPKGYRPVWEDDRLNPRRAEQSLEGIARTRLIWTQTVPRRLIDRATGEDVTAKVALVHPYTDTATQQSELGTVTLVMRDGQLMKRIVRNKAKARTPTVSTRSAPQVVTPTKATAPAKVAAPVNGRFVQVGTYGQPANAQSAAQRILRAGLPARIGKVQRGGKSYQVVLAGPFADAASLGQGLRASRSAGFSDAFVR